MQRLLLILLFILATTLSYALLNINTATKKELMQLKGIGEKKAEDIIAYRLEHGGFYSVEELITIKGIGEKTILNLKKQLIIK